MGSIAHYLSPIIVAYYRCLILVMVMGDGGG